MTHKFTSSSIRLREYIKEHKYVSPYDFWKWYRKNVNDVQYTSIVRLFWMCKKLGLIVVHDIVPNNHGTYKTLYKLNKDMIDSEKWSNPQEYMGWYSYKHRHEY